MQQFMLTLREVLRATKGEWVGSPEVLVRPIVNVSTDSRSIGAGELFFAIKGDRFDGHDFVTQVFSRGALAAVVSMDWYRKNGGSGDKNLLVVENTLIAFQESARFYRRKFNIPVIAITGSSGKTTTKEAIFNILSQKYSVLRNRKSFNNFIGVPITLFALRPTHEMLVTEVGTNHFGELERLGYLVEPLLVVLTNIGPAHLEFFKNLSGVLKAKLEILKYCRPGGSVIFNADDRLLREQSFSGYKTFSFAIENDSDLTARVIECDELARYTIELLGQTVKLLIPGRHTIFNVLAAAAVGLQFDMTPSEIRTGVEALLPFEKRMEIGQIHGLTLLSDVYNANPDSCRAALQTLKDLKINHGKKIAILGDMLELGDFSKAEHRKLTDLFVDLKIDAMYLYGNETVHAYERAVELELNQVAHFDNKKKLADSVLGSLKKGDAVLVKGSRGMQMETIVGEIESYFKKQS